MSTTTAVSGAPATSCSTPDTPSASGRPMSSSTQSTKRTALRASASRVTRSMRALGRPSASISRTSRASPSSSSTTRICQPTAGARSDARLPRGAVAHGSTPRPVTMRSVAGPVPSPSTRTACPPETPRCAPASFHVGWDHEYPPRGSSAPPPWRVCAQGGPGRDGDMAPSPAPGPVRVVLANDDHIIIEGLRAMLAPYDDQVEVVATAEGDRDRPGGRGGHLRRRDAHRRLHPRRRGHRRRGPGSWPRTRRSRSRCSPTPTTCGSCSRRCASASGATCSSRPSRRTWSTCSSASATARRSSTRGSPPRPRSWPPAPSTSGTGPAPTWA